MALYWDFEGDRHVADLQPDRDTPSSPLDLHEHKAVLSKGLGVQKTLGPFLVSIALVRLFLVKHST
jgi:hypothetical protein